jgi:hypothetical protein
LTDSTVKASMSVEAIANDIVLAGGSAEAAEIDVLDEHAVDKHLQSVIEKVDIERWRVTQASASQGPDPINAHWLVRIYISTYFLNSWVYEL